VLERAVSSEGVCPCGGTPVLQPVTATGDRLERAFLPLLLAEPRTLLQRIRDHFAACRAKTVIIQLEDGKALVMREEETMESMLRPPKV
jgi:hypothetical protein